MDKIAKTGTYTDMHGKVYTFTASDFEAIAANYAQINEKAPLVVGHPSADAPAYGWIASLHADNNYLYAEYENVSDTIKEAVNNGEYRYKSISLYPDLKRLKHVGLLGAVPPAMSGLGTVQFGAGESIILSFAENIETGVKSMTLEEALQKVAELQATLTKLQEDNAALKASLEKMTGDKKDAEVKAAESEANFATFKKDVSLKARTARVDTLIAQGKLEPARKDEVMKIAGKLSDGAPAFAASSGESLEDNYLKGFESREQNKMLAEFGSPEQTKQEPYSTKDVVEKL